MSELSQLLCPGCAYKVGVPISQDGKTYTPTERPAVMICVKCMEFLMFESGKLSVMKPNVRAFFFMRRPNEVLSLLQTAMIADKADRDFGRGS